MKEGGNGGKLIPFKHFHKIFSKKKRKRKREAKKNSSGDRKEHMEKIRIFFPIKKKEFIYINLHI